MMPSGRGVERVGEHLCRGRMEVPPRAAAADASKLPRHFDLDGSGYIEKQELAALTKQLGQAFSREELNVKPGRNCGWIVPLPSSPSALFSDFCT